MEREKFVEELDRGISGQEREKKEWEWDKRGQEMVAGLLYSDQERKAIFEIQRKEWNGLRQRQRRQEHIRLNLGWSVNEEEVEQEQITLLGKQINRDGFILDDNRRVKYSEYISNKVQKN